MMKKTKRTVYLSNKSKILVLRGKPIGEWHGRAVDDERKDKLLFGVFRGFGK